MFLLYTRMHMASHLLEPNQKLHNRVLIPICNNMLVVQKLGLWQVAYLMAIAICFKIIDRCCLVFLTLMFALFALCIASSYLLGITDLTPL